MSNGKYSKNQSFNVRPLVLVLAVALLIGATIGGTIAWLTASTKTVENTFTVGNINIDLKESDTDPIVDNQGNVIGYKKDDFKMVPGNTIAKNPEVTVMADSEACWLFVEVTKSNEYDTYLEHEIAEGWEVLDGSNPSVYWRKVGDLTQNGGVIATEQKFSVLANDQVSVKSTVTKAMMDSLDGLDAEGKLAQNEIDNRPMLVFRAYAIQQANIGTDKTTDAEKAAVAWAEVKQ